MGADPQGARMEDDSGWGAPDFLETNPTIPGVISHPKIFKLFFFLFFSLL